jgi:hypothetical protein
VAILNIRTTDFKKPQLSVAVSLAIAMVTISGFAQVTVSSLDSVGSTYQEEFSRELKSLWKTSRFLGLAALGQQFSAEGKFEKSNLFLESAYMLESDYLAKHLPRQEECYEDDHDLFMVLYFKALNYLSLSQPAEAFVECRRMDELLAEANATRLGRRLACDDPLIHVTMGLIYEINGEYDNSLISYNRAKTLFEGDYRGSASKEIPLQLIRDLQKVTEWADQPRRHGSDNPYGELIFIWHNGSSARKANLRRDFKITYRHGKLLGSDSSRMPREDVIGNKILPFFKYSYPNFWEGTLVCNGHDIKCELLEDATWYSIKVLQTRLNLEGTHVWRKGEDWNTLPQSIYYARVPLSKGKNYFDFIIHGYGGSVKDHSFSCEGNGKTYFHLFTSLENHEPAH